MSVCSYNSDRGARKGTYMMVRRGKMLSSRQEHIMTGWGKTMLRLKSERTRLDNNTVITVNIFKECNYIVGAVAMY
jgi:hypothetical protein